MKVLVTSHKNFAQGIISALEFIAGTSNKLISLELDDDGIGSYHKRLNELLNKEKEQILILTDLRGGTPYNEAFKYYLEHSKKVRVISGLNLPMLLELIPKLSNHTNLTEAVDIALKAGKTGISEAYDKANDEEIEF
jgi:mannose PTS system EIIA component